MPEAGPAEVLEEHLRRIPTNPVTGEVWVLTGNEELISYHGVATGVVAGGATRWWGGRREYPQSDSRGRSRTDGVSGVRRVRDD